MKKILYPWTFDAPDCLQQAALAKEQEKLRERARQIIEAITKEKKDQ